MADTTVKAGGISKITTRYKNPALTSISIMLVLVFAFIFSCTKDENIVPNDNATLDTRGGDKVKPGYEVTNLVSDTDEYNPERIDPNLVNAWGIALSPTGVFWISAADKQLSVIYNDEGAQLRPPVTMTNNPTGQVFNGTTGFPIPGGAARFIFVTEQGTINAWRSGNVAVQVADRSSFGATYTGVELANDGSGNFLYVANGGNGGSIDVFDDQWNYITTKPFTDASAPPGYPFNIRLIDGLLYVTYAGPGETGGFVNIFNTNGGFIKRFATGGALDAPWGITKTPPEFGLGQAILVGNFHDGRINVYNKNGQFKGQLADVQRNPIEIEGLWALTFVPGSTDFSLYFTAGPDDEEHGLFGEIEFVGDNETTSGLMPTAATIK